MPSNDVEKQSSDEFSDVTVRHQFIRTVYMILTVQLLFTLGVIAVFIFVEPVKVFVFEHFWLYYVAIGVCLVTMLALACCGDLRRSFPCNFICLALFTAAESFTCGVLACVFAPTAVFYAIGLTAVLCFGLTIFAMQTKIDFTMWGGALLVLMLILLVLGIVSFFVRDKIFQLVVASLAVFIYSLFLIYDTQLMLGGDHQESISPDEYVFAALMLYIDVIRIFTCILSIFGILSDD